MGTTKPLSGDTSIADWLADPAGNAILTEMLAEGGQSPEGVKPVRRLAIRRLVKMRRGAFTRGRLDALTRGVQRGDVPAGNLTVEVAASDDLEDEAPAVPLREWTERINEGRFTGQTLIVTGAGSGI